MKRPLIHIPFLKEPAVTGVGLPWLILWISLAELADAQTAGKTLLLGVSLRVSLGEISTGIRRQRKEEGPPSPRRGTPANPLWGSVEHKAGGPTGSLCLS